MKQNKDVSYKCMLCEGRYTNTLHEIFYGTSNRKISIEYNLQTPLCNECHINAHKHKELSQVIFCRKLGISFSITKRMINNFKENKEYFEGIKKHCREKLKSWEV